MRLNFSDGKIYVTYDLVARMISYELNSTTNWNTRDLLNDWKKLKISKEKTLTLIERVKNDTHSTVVRGFLEAWRKETESKEFKKEDNISARGSVDNRFDNRSMYSRAPKKNIEDDNLSQQS